MTDKALDTRRPTQSRDKRLLLIMLAMGLLAVGTLAFTALETVLPPGIKVPRGLLLIQPAILVTFGTVLGWWLGPKTGLGAPLLDAMLEGRDWRYALRAASLPVAVVALGSAMILVGYAVLVEDQFVLPGPIGKLYIPAITRLGYGGIGEELIARWGILTAVMAAALKLGVTRGAAFWSANGVAAVLFAAGHLGLLFTLLAHPPLWLVGTVMAGNIVPALGFGWLYRRNGIEAAMLAHAGAHLLALIATAAGLG
jgi:hypothetical protein